MILRQAQAGNRAGKTGPLCQCLDSAAMAELGVCGKLTKLFFFACPFSRRRSAGTSSWAGLVFDCSAFCHHSIHFMTHQSFAFY